MTITQTLVLESLTCGVCSIPFALEQSHLAALKKNGQTFYCPNGHTIGYGKSEADKLRARLLSTEASLDYARQRRDEAEKQVVIHKGRATRFKNERDRVKRRVAAGMCPCCNRHFTNLERHMDNKHPGYVTPDSEA